MARYITCHLPQQHLVAAHVVLQSKAWDAERQWVVAKDKLEGYQVSCAEAVQGELEKEFEEKDVRPERDSQMIA